ncbi:organic cation transporter protein-like [Anneissia japonica]|uniref:organic cation transporter protein-like n=1 Tax=Anneissia japonica TaxID=1529436 RepID=UPI00142588F3|nr:organic cation transporter protein-like [Anneissia japonica]
MTAIYAYFIRYWRKLLIFICLVDVFIFLVIILLVPESPRWLHSIGRFDEAEAIIQKASKYKKEIPVEVYKELREEKVDDQTENSNASVKDLFHNKVMCLRTIVITTLGFIINCVYFGVSLSAIRLSSNDYLAVGLSAAVEIPACLLSRLAVDQWGRRPILGSAILMAGLSCIGIAFTSDWLIMVFGLTGKFAISSCYNIHFVFAAEIFPTPVRNVGIGLATMVGNCGAVLAPQLMYIGVVWEQLPYFIFGCFSGIGVLLILLLPETKGTNLPQSIQEGKTLGVKIASADLGETGSEAQCHDTPFDVMEME